MTGTSKCAILCVVTGMEKSGTTFLSKLLAADPSIMCGFECGILLSDIRDFNKQQPFYGWMSESTDIGHWGIRPEHMAEICSAADYDTAYRLIKKYAGELGSPHLRACFQHATWIIDKTPRYIFDLDTIMAKVDLPFIVIQKDVLDQYLSFKNRSYRIEDFVAVYAIYLRRLRSAAETFPDRLLIVRHTDLVRRQTAEMQRICRFLHIPFNGHGGLARFYDRTGLKKHGGLHRRFSADTGTPALAGYEIRILRTLERLPSVLLRILAASLRYWIAVKVIAKKCLDIMGYTSKPGRRR